MGNGKRAKADRAKSVRWESCESDDIKYKYPISHHQVSSLIKSLKKGNLHVIFKLISSYGNTVNMASIKHANKLMKKGKT